MPTHHACNKGNGEQAKNVKESRQNRNYPVVTWWEETLCAQKKKKKKSVLLRFYHVWNQKRGVQVKFNTLSQQLDRNTINPQSWAQNKLIRTPMSGWWWSGGILLSAWTPQCDLNQQLQLGAPAQKTHKRIIMWIWDSPKRVKENKPALPISNIYMGKSRRVQRSAVLGQSKIEINKKIDWWRWALLQQPPPPDTCHFDLRLGSCFQLKLYQFFVNNFYHAKASVMQLSPNYSWVRVGLRVGVGLEFGLWRVGFGVRVGTSVFGSAGGAFGPIRLIVPSTCA